MSVAFTVFSNIKVLNKKIRASPTKEWYDKSGNLVSTNAEYGYVETIESVNTYYARFSNSVTQTYIRQIKNGDSGNGLLFYRLV